GAVIVGAAAIALSPDLGAGVPVAPVAVAQMDVDAAAAGDRGRGRAARGRRRTEPAADARRPPAFFLRHCDGLPRRVGAHPPVRLFSALLALGLNANRWKILATVVLALVLIRAYPADKGRVETVRSFFGVHKILVTPRGQYHVLMHGTTIHGAEKFQNNDGT